MLVCLLCERVIWVYCICSCKVSAAGVSIVTVKSQCAQYGSKPHNLPLFFTGKTSDVITRWKLGVMFWCVGVSLTIKDSAGKCDR